MAQHQSYLASLCHSVERIPMVTPHGVFNLHVTPVGIATEGGGGGEAGLVERRLVVSVLLVYSLVTFTERCLV